MIASIRNVTSYSKCFSQFFWKFLNYLVCLPSFKSKNSSFLSKKSMMRGNFTLDPRQRLQCQIISVGIGLIELTKPSDTLNYKAFFKSCISQSILHLFVLFTLVWNEIFFSKNRAVLFVLDLVWGGIRCIVLKVLSFWDSF